MSVRGAVRFWILAEAAGTITHGHQTSPTNPTHLTPSLSAGPSCGENPGPDCPDTSCSPISLAVAGDWLAGSTLEPKAAPAPAAGAEGSSGGAADAAAASPPPPSGMLAKGEAGGGRPRFRRERGAPTRLFRSARIGAGQQTG